MLPPFFEKIWRTSATVRLRLSVIASTMTAGGALLGAIVTSAFDGTVRPFAVGILAFISISALFILFGATGNLAAPAEQAEGATLA